MEEERIIALQLCLDDCERLLKLMANDEERFRDSLGGELLAEYCRSTEQARHTVKHIQDMVTDLRQEQIMLLRMRDEIG